MLYKYVYIIIYFSHRRSHLLFSKISFISPYNFVEVIFSSLKSVLYHLSHFLFSKISFISPQNIVKVIFSSLKLVYSITEEVDETIIIF